MPPSLYHYCMLLFFIFAATYLEGRGQDGTADPPPVALESTELVYVSSAITGSEYELLVALPPGYASDDTQYPVIYLLDAYRLFPMVKNIVDIFTFPYDIIPPVIIVGIGYGGSGVQASLNWVAGRTRDLTPEVDTAVNMHFEKQIVAMGFPKTPIESGGAGAFLEALRTEIIPFVESRYKADSTNRLLAGHSYGGLFGLYALFSDPSIFDKYLLSSPSMHFKKGTIFNNEKQYASSHGDLQAQVFMSCGDEEEATIADIHKMEELFRSRNYPGLELHTWIIERSGHVTCAPTAMTQGLKALLGKQKGE